VSTAPTRVVDSEGAGGQFKTLYHLLKSLIQAATAREVYEAAIDSLMDATAADRAAILLFDEDGVMRFQASRGLSQRYQEAVTGHSPWTSGQMNAQPIVVRDVMRNKSVAGYRRVLANEGIRALAFLPLISQNGVFGKFMLYYEQPHSFPAEELEVAQTIADHVALAAEHRLRQEERTRSASMAVASRHLAAIIESSGDAIISKDLNGLITSWNQGAERIFGYRAEEVIGKPVSILAAPERTSEMPSILARIRLGERVEHFETRRRRKDGQIIDVSLSVSPVRDEAGRIVGASKIARDITAQKAAQRERLVLLARERESRRTAEVLNQVGPRLLALMDLEKLAQEATDIATPLLGADFGVFFQLAANHQGELHAVHALSGFPPESLAALVLPEFHGEQVIRVDDVTEDPRFGPAAAGFGLRSFVAAPVVAHSKEVLGALFFGNSDAGAFTASHESIVAGIAAQTAIAMDNARLYEQARWVQSELKRSNEELRRANGDLEVFAYSASHDLQEPLRTIAISAQLIERSVGEQLPAEERGFLSEIASAGRRMSALISDLLAYTRATKYEEGAPPLIESGQVLAGVVAGLGGAIRESGATVVADDLPAVAMHECRLTLLFQNLIGNALKYRGKEVPRVEVKAGQDDGWTVFSITDNGIGMEPQYREQIFGLFKRLHSRSEIPGSGIGLAICQRVVEQYGGRIWVERSAPGLGSTFCFSVPSRS
jgi:PAS domain S-box-containing protein